MAVASGDAPPLEPAVLEACGLLDEQPAAASARMATTPADFTALERFTWELPFTCSGAASARRGLVELAPRRAAARRDWSTYTAATRTVPTATPCQNGWTPMITNPAWSTAGMNRPTTVPKIEPSPPKMDVPPITTAAITLRLVRDWPAMVVVPNWASDIAPANPASSPGERVDPDEVPVDPDADAAGGLLVGADRVRVAAEPGAVQHDAADDEDDQGDEGQRRDAEDLDVAC